MVHRRQPLRILWKSKLIDGLRSLAEDRTRKIWSPPLGPFGKGKKGEQVSKSKLDRHGNLLATPLLVCSTGSIVTDEVDRSEWSNLQPVGDHSWWRSLFIASLKALLRQKRCRSCPPRNLTGSILIDMIISQTRTSWIGELPERTVDKLCRKHSPRLPSVQLSRPDSTAFQLGIRWVHICANIPWLRLQCHLGCSKATNPLTALILGGSSHPPSRDGRIVAQPICYRLIYPNRLKNSPMNPSFWIDNNLVTFLQYSSFRLYDLMRPSIVLC